MQLGRLILGVSAISVVVVHVVFRRPLAAIVPDYLPAHRDLVVGSGALAALGGVGLLVPTTQRIAAWGLIGWLVAVFPANLWMAQHPGRYSMVPAWMLWARLPLQVPMIWWVWQYTRPHEMSR